MKRVFSVVGVLLSVVILVSLILLNHNQNNELELANDVITNYLDLLSENKRDELSEYTTNERMKNISEGELEQLEKYLLRAELKELTVRIRDTKRMIIDAKVEVECSQDFIATGDWVPGTTISSKSFELLKVDDKWKVNGWAVY